MKSNYDCFRIAMLLKELYSKTMYTVEENFKENGLTHQQIIVIKLIAHNQELTISQLCDEMSLAKGTVSGIISRLEQIGYIENSRNLMIKEIHTLSLQQQDLNLPQILKLKCKKVLMIFLKIVMKTN